MKILLAKGKVPSSFSSTRVQNTPGGVPFSNLQLTVQDWHPVQRLRSTATPHLMALRVFEVTFAVIASLSPATNACIYKSAGLGNRAKNAIRLWRIPAPSVAFPHGLRDVHAR
jgi:hypothetical protein